jgi:4,5-dihydroxyphthalate decarboxylase
MGKIRLTLACWDYDRTRALQEGRVEVEGVELTYLPLRVEETFWRMLRYGEFDAAELSTGSYLMSRDKGFPKLMHPVFLPKPFDTPAFYQYRFRNQNRRTWPANAWSSRAITTMAIWARDLAARVRYSPEKMKWLTGGEEHRATRTRSSTICTQYRSSP